MHSEQLTKYARQITRDQMDKVLQENKITADLDGLVEVFMDERPEIFYDINEDNHAEHDIEKFIKDRFNLI